MDISHISLLRDSYMKESNRPDGRKSTIGEYVKFITDSNIEFVTSKDMVFTDDNNSIVHCVCINEDMVSQADFPVKIISAAYEDIHAIETIMSRENFKKFLNDGYLSNISGSKKDFMIKWVDSLRIQAQQPMEPYPYYDQDASVISKTNTRLLRDDGITIPNTPATLASRVLSADTNEESLLMAIAAGKEEIVLTNDITLEKSLELTQDAKIDLGGHTLASADKTRAIIVKSGNVTISNGTIIGNGNDALYLNGIIKEGGNAPSLTLMEDVNVIADDCAVLLKGPGATLNTYAYLESIGGEYAAIQGNGAYGGITVNIYGGSVISKDVAIYFPSKTELNVYGGTITGSSAVYHKSGKLNIHGGVFIANGDKIAYTYNPNGCNSTGDAIVIEACNYPDGVPMVSITSGEFTSINANAIGYYQQSTEFALDNTRFITGGKYSNDISEFIAEGYSMIENNSAYTVSAAIYSSGLAVESGEEDINTTVSIGNTNGEKVYAVYANGKNTVLNITGGYYDSGIGGSNVAVVAKDGATINISDGYFVSRYDENGYGNSCVEVNAGTINISGGTFECTTPYKDKYWVLNKKDNTGANIIVTGGTFVNFDPSSGNTENPNESFVAPGYYVEKTDNLYTVKAIENTTSIAAEIGIESTIDTSVDLGNTTEKAYAVYAEGENTVLNITGGYYNSGNGSSNATLVARNGAIINVSDGHFISGHDEDGYGNACVETNGGIINISGGYFECTTPYMDKYWVLNKKDNTGAVINVTGGTFVNFDPSSGNTENPDESFVAKGYHVEVNGNEYTVVPD